MGLSDDEDFQAEGLFCPACGRQSLEIRARKLRCFYDFGDEKLRCPDPDAAAKILSDPEIHHIVRFDTAANTFSVQHPLRERIGQALLDCSIHDVVREQIDFGFIEPDDRTWRLVYSTGAYVPGGPDQEPDWHWEET
jgi:hypothetical protein